MLTTSVRPHFENGEPDMRRITLWIVATVAALVLLISYQLSVNATPDRGHHGAPPLVGAAGTN